MLWELREDPTWPWGTRGGRQRGQHVERPGPTNGGTQKWAWHMWYTPRAQEAEAHGTKRKRTGEPGTGRGQFTGVPVFICSCK